MPLVKIDYVVSFSSEDPDHPASNLLSSDVTSKWLCTKGEPSCSVVLQLKSACKIDSITIGAYHVAVLEVLVGSSEKPNDPFEVLVPSCVLLSPAASRRGDSVECVRTFGAAQLAGAAARRWDRVRLACSQPYNKHCKYGLAFVHISSSETQPAAASTPASAPVSTPPSTQATAPVCTPASAPLRLLKLDADAGSSDEEFRPGELFAKHQRGETTRQSTDAQIRQASSQALKNIPHASSQLTRAHIDTPGGRARVHTDTPGERARVHTDTPGERARVHTDTPQRRTAHTADTAARERPHHTPPATPPASTRPDTSHHKRKRSDDSRRPAPEHPELGPVCAARSDVLAGVCLALSGYVNPRRASLRSAALELGARYLREPDPTCTHLVCAFPNTPKLRSLRAEGSRAVAVTGEWLEQCHARRRRLPWRWFATEPQQRQPIPPHFERDADQRDQEGDTDDEIEKVLKQQGKKQRRSPSPTRPDAPTDTTDAGSAKDATDASGSADAMDASTDSDVAFVRDERVQAQISLHSDSDATDEDERAPHPDSEHITRELPHWWAGSTFLLSTRLSPATAARLARYIRAYGGLVLQESQLQADSSVQYAVGPEDGALAADARRVSPGWVWRQHARRGLAASPR